MSQVFVSYSRRDQQWVSKLVDALRGAGVEVWIDTEDIPVSLPWLDQVRDAIQESGLVVVCESPAQRSSIPCGAEVATAVDLGRSTVSVEVETPIVDAVGRVLDAIAARPPLCDVGVELEVRAREWDRRGRSRRLLIPGRRLDALFDARPFVIGSTSVIDSFLVASRRRRRRRRLVGTIAVFVGLLSFRVATEVTERFGGIAADRAEVLASNLDRLDVGVRLLDADVYAGIGEAASQGATSHAALVSGLLELAMEAVVPDNVIEAPIPGDDTVDPADESSTDLEVVWTTGTAEVEVKRAGARVRRLVATGPIHDLAVDPFGWEFAVAVHDRIEIIDIETGFLRMTLRGSPTSVRELAWSTDGTRVFGRADDVLLSWQRRTGSTVIDDPTLRFRNVHRSVEAGGIWVLEESGELLHVELDSGQVMNRIELPGPAYSAAFNADATFAVVTGAEETWKLDLATRAVTVLASSCGVGAEAFHPDGQLVVLGCEPGVRIVDIATGSVEATVELPPSVSALSMSYSPDGNALLIGSTAGTLFRYDGSLERLDRPPGYWCDADVLVVTHSPAGHITTGGAGTGQLHCTVRGMQGDDGELEWALAWFSNVAPSRSRAVLAPERGDVFVHGLADGSVVMWPIEGIAPTWKLVDVPGDVWGLAEVDGDLVVSTRSGVIHRLPMPTGGTDNSAMSAVLLERLTRAVELGLADRSVLDRTENAAVQE